jgi:hypothetical protein
MGEKQTMIQDQELWNKIKNLTGTDKEVKRLFEVMLEGKITETEYWNVRAQWSKNAHKLIKEL